MKNTRYVAYQIDKRQGMLLCQHIVGSKEKMLLPNENNPTELNSEHRHPSGRAKANDLRVGGHGSQPLCHLEKEKRKTPVKVCASLHPLTVQEKVLNPATDAVSYKRTLAFNPRYVFAKLSGGKTCEKYKADESVFSQGDAADAVFYIASGKVKLTVVSEHGRSAVVAILPEANFFGEECLAGQKRRMFTASTFQPTTVFRVTRQTMLALLRQEPELAEHFLTHLLSRNIRMEADLVDHLFNSSEKRLARLLLLLAHFGEEAKPTPLIAKIGQDTLASMIGTTRSRVSYFMNRFRKLGFIDYGEDGIHVHCSLVSVVLQD